MTDNWIDRVVAGLIGEPPGPNVDNLRLANVFRRLRGEPELSWPDYVAGYVPPDPAELARWLDDARAEVALEEAFLRGKVSDDWV